MSKWMIAGRILRVTALGFSAWAVAGSVWAQAAIESISSSIQDGADVVRIELNQALVAEPAGFVVQSPPRVALDFPGVTSGVSGGGIDINRGNLLRANVVQAGDRTRVVLSLKQPTTYKTAIQGNALLVTLDRVATSTVAAPAASVFAEAENDHMLPLVDVDFRRGIDNAGRVVIDLASDQVGVDIREQGQKLVVDFLETSLPEGLRRNLDVSDFGTPVQTISAVQSGERVRMEIESLGAWEHSAYQSDRQLVLEVRQVSPEPNKLAAGQDFRGEKLSLNFQDVDVRSLLQVIADFTNFNIVTSDSVQGSLTLRLRDVPWDQALDIILQAKDLGMKRIGNVLQIAPKDEMAAKDLAELEAQKAIRDLEPLRTESFQLNYTKAEEIKNQLTDSGSGSGGSGTGSDGRLLSSRGSVIAERRTNQLFVSDIPSRLEQIREMIVKLDVPVRQVMIEARIVEATDTFGKSLGVKLGGADMRGIRGGDAGYSVGNNHRVAFGGNYGAIASTTGQSTGGLTDNATQFLSMPASGMGFGTPANFAISLFSSAANRFLNLELSALEADGKGKIVSSPRVVTADQTQAVIKQGQERAYQEATSSGATAVSFKEAVLKLEVTPQITPEGNIILDLEVSKDSFAPSSGFDEPAINKKEIQTNVLVENGGTVVIGGIFELTESEQVNKVPLLGDIPVMGHLFKQRTRQADKQEMLVFITPRVISDHGGVR